MLDVIGEQPVNSLEGQQVTEARQAQNSLMEFHREGQCRGWTWNTEEAFPFRADAERCITVPETALSFTVVDTARWGTRFVLRGQRVYDREQHSYVLPVGLGELLADVVWALPWGECPEAFNRWTTIRAARAFAGRILGDASIPRLVALDEEQAMVELQRIEGSQSQANWLSSHPAMPTFRPETGLARNARGEL